jgi:hypothetical protein
MVNETSLKAVRASMEALHSELKILNRAKSKLVKTTGDREGAKKLMKAIKERKEKLEKLSDENVRLVLKEIGVSV